MKWTDQKPTESGFYWLKDGSAEVVVQVDIGLFDSFRREYVWFPGSDSLTELYKITGQWAGPITPPEEP